MTDEKNEGYQVGYGKPPVNRRFQKGQSGNPKGRPPRSQNYTTLLLRELNERLVVSENGRRKTITKREAMIKQLVNKAVSGDPGSLKLLRSELREIEDRLGMGDGPIPIAVFRRVVEMLEEDVKSIDAVDPGEADSGQPSGGRDGPRP